jgi:hypothetical protein
MTLGSSEILIAIMGHVLSKLPNHQIQIELNHQFMPSTQRDLPIAPNFFLAAKGPDGSASVAYIALAIADPEYVSAASYKR